MLLLAANGSGRRRRLRRRTSRVFRSRHPLRHAPHLLLLRLLCLHRNIAEGALPLGTRRTAARRRRLLAQHGRAGRWHLMVQALRLLLLLRSGRLLWRRWCKVAHRPRRVLVAKHSTCIRWNGDVGLHQVRHAVDTNLIRQDLRIKCFCHVLYFILNKSHLGKVLRKYHGNISLGRLQHLHHLGMLRMRRWLLRSLHLMEHVLGLLLDDHIVRGRRVRMLGRWLCLRLSLGLCRGLHLSCWVKPLGHQLVLLDLCQDAEYLFLLVHGENGMDGRHRIDEQQLQKGILVVNAAEIALTPALQGTIDLANTIAIAGAD